MKKPITLVVIIAVSLVGISFYYISVSTTGTQLNEISSAQNINQTRENTTKTMAKQLEETPYLIHPTTKDTPSQSRSIASIERLSQPTVDQLSVLLPEYLTKGLEAEEGRKLLLESNGYRYHELVHHVHDKIDNLDSTKLYERLYLFGVTNKINELSYSDEIKHMMLEQAEQYKESQDPKFREYSEFAFNFYLQLEKDENQKNIRNKEFHSEHENTE